MTKTFINSSNLSFLLQEMSRNLFLTVSKDICFGLVKQLKSKVPINFQKRLKLIYLQQEMPKNLFLTISKDFCFRHVNPI